ncbi:MAG: hypothetical protein LBL19_04120 [Spirochaetaceae bacterium]|jgi:hypothetical protein|nr:hypothetical protein [Spirochaetaceae bacterium]
MKRRIFFLSATGLILLLLSSCIGVTTKITIRNNGAGTLEAEYRISRAVDSLGKLDGNEGWPPLPVGRADFERTVSRVDGLRLTSFSSREDEKDRVIRVKMDFSHPEALAGFLDASGQRARLSREGQNHRLSLTLGGGIPHQAPELLELAETAFEGYTMELDLTLPRDMQVTVTDGNGREIGQPPAGTLRETPRNLRFSSSMAALLSSNEPVCMEILW